MTTSKQDDQESLGELRQRYELQNLLREEPGGEVWLVADRLLHTEIALKILPRTSPDWDMGHQFLVREAALSLVLRHPLILGVFYLGEVEDGLYLVEEPFLGESLLGRLSRKRRFSVPETLRLLEQVSQALAFAHQRGVAHQILNPLHILLKDEEVRVANFACTAGDDEQALHLELRAYTPPEVIHGEEASPGGNVFSLGVLGYRLLAGSLPYPLTFDEPFPYRLESMPLDLEEIPLPLQNLLLQCLAPEPEDRFADAGVLLNHLRQLREFPEGGSRDAWGLDASPGTGAAWRHLGTGTAAVLEKIRDLGKFSRQQLSALGALKPGAGPANPRLWWGLGLAGMLLVLIFLGTQVLRQAPHPPEPEPAPVAGPAAAPGLKAGPPLVEPAEPESRAEPQPLAKPGPLKPAPEPRASLASPGPQRPQKSTLKKERYLVIAATFTRQNQAQALARRLQGKKYPVRVGKTKVKGKTAYLVRLGPFTEKKKAAAALRRLQTREHLQPLLITLKPKPNQAPAARRRNR